MYEDFINALQNFRQNKTRTILSLLGIIIGVASVIIITTIGSSATYSIKSSFASSGLDLITASSGGMRYQANSTAVQFNDSFRQDIFDHIAQVNAVFYKNTFNATVRYNGTDVNASINCVEENYVESCGLLLDYGSFFNVSDYVTGEQKIILGATTADSLFPEGEAVGKSVVLDMSGSRFGFTVIGVLKSLDGMGVEMSDSAAYVTRGFWKKKIASTPYNASTMVIQVSDQTYSTQAASDIEAYVLQTTGSSNSISVRSMASMLSQFDQITGTLSLLLSGVAAISLLVGGIGIMNIMIVTVTERRKEIGIRKALGAAPNAIRNQFLVESASLTLLGGIIGIVFGLLLSFAVDYVLNWNFSVQWIACAIAFIFSACVGVFFGLSPAVRAARLNPVDALASE